MAEFSDADLAAALARCAREPVHTPGGIQTGGCLVSLEADLSGIRQVSANLGAFLGLSAEEALASEPSRVLGSRVFKRLQREWAHAVDEPLAFTARRRVAGKNRHFRVTAYRSADRVVVELEPSGRARSGDLFSSLNAWLLRIEETRTSQALLETLVEAARELIGHERVMVYRFDEDGHGRVIAESCNETAISYLNHHFPASDIPSQVRRLYDINRLRSIPDATAESVPLVPEADPKGQGSLDLSPGVLRGVSPVHLNYLGNMGVNAALSVAMHNESGLWGLLAGHAFRPTPAPPEVRDAVQALTQSATSRLMLIEARHEAAYLRTVQQERKQFSGARGEWLAPSELITMQGAGWLELFRADALALVYQREVSSIGNLPREADLLAITDRLSGTDEPRSAWSTNALGETQLADTVAETAHCGLLAVPLRVPHEKPGWLLVFRREQVETRIWAGRDDDLQLEADGSVYLAPRRSFGQWQEEVRGRSEQWQEIEIQAASDLAQDLALVLFNREIEQLNARLTDANLRLKDLAETNAVTGLPNRLVLADRVTQGIIRAQRDGHHLALLFLDLDHFKDVNDSLGHQAGDELLQEVAVRLQATLRGTDTVAHLGGDEFTIVIGEMAAPSDASTVADKLLQALLPPFEVEGEAIQLSLSIGIACFPDHGQDFNELLHRADVAMYEAKAQGRAAYRYFSPDML